MRNINATDGGRARTLTASAVLVLGLGGLAACADSEGPEEGVTTEDLTSLQEEVSALDDRVTAMEEDLTDPAVGVEEGGPEVVGQEVTVSAEVSEVITSNDNGGAFRIAGDTGPSVAVLATAPPNGLEQDDVVQVTGTVKPVNRDSFEQDFGVAEGDLFEDPDAFFEETEGQPAIAATSIEVIEENE